MPSTLRALAMVTVLLLAGCTGLGGQQASGDAGDLSADSARSGGDGGGGADGGRQAAVEATAAPQATPAESQSGDTNADQPARQRAIIKTGEMRLRVDNFTRSREALASRARSLGGYVGDSGQRLHRDGDRQWTTGYVVVRVPSGEYERMQESVGQRGTVLSESTSTKDVTDQLVDLEARLANLKSRRDRLRTFYNRANSTEELLRIEEELSEVQGEIERLEAQKRSLERRVAFSTLRIELREPSPGPDAVTTQYHERPLASVFLGSLRDIYVFGRATLVTVAAVLPWLGLAGVPLVVGRYALRRRGVRLRTRIRNVLSLDRGREDGESNPDDDTPDEDT